MFRLPALFELRESGTGSADQELVEALLWARE